LADVVKYIRGITQNTPLTLKSSVVLQGMLEIQGHNTDFCFFTKETVFCPRNSPTAFNDVLYMPHKISHDFEQKLNKIMP